MGSLWVSQRADNIFMRTVMKRKKLTITICPPNRGIHANFQCGISGGDLKKKYAFRAILPFMLNGLSIMAINEEETSLLLDRGFSPTGRRMEVKGTAFDDYYSVPIEIEDQIVKIRNGLEGYPVPHDVWTKLAGYFFYDTDPHRDVTVISGADAKEFELFFDRDGYATKDPKGKLKEHFDALFDKDNRIPHDEIDPEVCICFGNMLKEALESHGYLVGDIELAIRPDLYRAGMRMELQKFPNRKKQIQLLLWENLEPEEVLKEVKVTGLDLTGSQDKAISAIQILLDKRGYTSDLPSSPIQSEAYHWSGSLPNIVTNYSEYFEAYGLEKKDGRYPRGRQRDEAVEALKSLTEPRRVLYQRKYWSGKGKKREQRSRIIRASKPIISILEGLDVSKDEASRVMAGEDLTRRVTKIVIEVSPLLMDEIDTFYMLKPKALRKEIASVTNKKNISETIPRFINWLLTKNQKSVSIGRDSLAERLGVYYLLETRQKKRLNKILGEAFDVAKKLKYINSYRESKPGILNFNLNPKMCLRVKMKQEDIKQISSSSVA
jgi:hypothetical protein